jgi:hypothetical protein
MDFDQRQRHEFHEFSHMVRRICFLALCLQPLAFLHATTSISATNKYAYGANIGWMDARGNTNSGAIIGEFVCSGYLYAADIGWIKSGQQRAGQRDSVSE